MEKQVADQLRKQIAEHFFERDQPLPSFSDLAAMFSVSKATVQNAIAWLKDEGLVITRVGRGTFIREEKTNGGEDYDTTRKPRSRMLHLAAIHFDIWGGLDDFLIPLIEGIHELCRIKKHNFQMHCIHGTTLESKENHLVHQLIFGKDVDGVLILSPIDPQDIRSLRRQRIPFVLAGPPAYQRSLNTVGVDLKAILRLFVEASLKQGKRRLAILTGPRKNARLQIKLTGDLLAKHFSQALREHDLTYFPELVKEGEYTEQSSRQEVLDLLTMQAPPEAILVIGDSMTRGALAAYKERGQHMMESPKRAKPLLISCAERSTGLTPVTIVQPLREMGICAATLLVDLLEGKRKPLWGHIESLQPRLVTHDLEQTNYTAQA